MEGEQIQQPTPIQQPVAEEFKEQPKPQKSSKMLTVLLVIITILSLCLSSYLAYQNYQLKEDISQIQLSGGQLETQVTPTTNPKTTQNPTVNWEVYTIDMFNVSLVLPPGISASQMEKTVSPGEVGSIICWTISDSQTGLITQVLASGQCGSNRFGITTMSKDFAAGRMANFTDTLGYKVEGETIYYIGVEGKTTPLSDELAELNTNQHDVEILKIIGATDHDEEMGTNFPTGGTPGEGVLGAIIMTGDDSYPAISIEMDIDGNLNEMIFDQVLSSIKFIE